MWRKMAVLATLGGLVVGGSAAARVHVVQRGETLEGIGRLYLDLKYLIGQLPGTAGGGV